MPHVGGLIIDGQRIIWKVNNFLQLDKDDIFTSPLKYANKKWELSLYPIGSFPSDMCKGWMYVRLENRTDRDIAFRIRLSLIGREGKAIFSTGADWMGSYYFQTPKLINRSELEFLGEEAMPGGTLTLVFEILTHPDSDLKKSEIGFKKSKNSGASFKADDRKPEKYSRKSSKELENSEVSFKADEGTASVEGLSKSVQRLLQDLEGILFYGNNSDVTLKVAGKSYKAHKAILAARSAGFSEIFSREASGEVSVEFGNAESFSDFLHYLYTGNESEVTPDNARDLYELAVSYRIDELKAVCLRCLVESGST